MGFPPQPERPVKGTCGDGSGRVDQPSVAIGRSRCGALGSVLVQLSRSSECRVEPAATRRGAGPRQYLRERTGGRGSAGDSALVSSPPKLGRWADDSVQCDLALTETPSDVPVDREQASIQPRFPRDVPSGRYLPESAAFVDRYARRPRRQLRGWRLFCGHAVRVCIGRCVQN